MNARHDLDVQLAERLQGLRKEREWSLEELARRSGVSRASLSRLENAETSATAVVLGQLCAAYGLTLSRLMHMVEGGFSPVVRRKDQQVWEDPETGFRRRVVSPPAGALAGEALEGELPAKSHISYDASPRPGLEHHIVVMSGRLEVTIENVAHDLGPGDCLRYQLRGPSAFTTGPRSGARYMLFMVEEGGR